MKFLVVCLMCLFGCSSIGLYVKSEKDTCQILDEEFMKNFDETKNALEALGAKFQWISKTCVYNNLLVNVFLWDDKGRMIMGTISIRKRGEEILFDEIGEYEFGVRYDDGKKQEEILINPPDDAIISMLRMRNIWR